MPYIAKDKREDLEVGEFTKAYYSDATTPGELNYLFTVFAREYVKTKGLNYQTINDVVGALEGAKLEFYRRIAAPYEDVKIAENGDLY